MNNFVETILKLVEESKELQKKELQLQLENKLFVEKLEGFLKANGAAGERISIPELMELAIRKSKEGILV